MQLQGRKRRSDPGMLHRAHTIAPSPLPLPVVLLNSYFGLCSASTFPSMMISWEASAVAAIKPEEVGGSKPSIPPPLPPLPLAVPSMLKSFIQVDRPSICLAVSCLLLALDRGPIAGPMQFAACVGALFFFFHSSGILGKSNTGKNGCKEKNFPTPPVAKCLCSSWFFKDGGRGKRYERICKYCRHRHLCLMTATTARLMTVTCMLTVLLC